MSLSLVLQVTDQVSPVRFIARVQRTQAKYLEAKVVQ